MRTNLKGAIVLLIAITMVFSTIAIADTNEQQIEMSKAGIKSTKLVQSDPVVNPSFGPVMFSQRYYEPDESWAFFTSDVGLDYIVADDFWELSGPICDIHWWGLSLFWTGTGWVQCDPAGMIFEIIFYDNSGAPVCNYRVSPTAVATGKLYSGFEMYYWEVVLDPCCELQNGWVSIQGQGSDNNCVFLWAGGPEGNNNAEQDWVPLDPPNNCAFQLTAEGDPCNPAIDVEKYVQDENGEWIDADTENEAIDIPVCNDVTYKIVIHNSGDVNLTNIVVKDLMHKSVKYISSDPEGEAYYQDPYWHIDWIFPGPLKPCETIEIFVTGHVEGPECSYDENHVKVEAHGCGQVVRDEDSAWIHCKRLGKPLNSPILNFLENHPNIFPFLQLFLHRLGLF
jgi:hypothetical protein